MRRFKLTWLLVAAMALASTAFVSVSRAAAGDHLSGSTFEGADGDLAAVGTLRGGDWNAPAGNVRAPVDVKHDRPTGGNDDSFAGGVKEDTASPSFVTGSIPNNKSDLLNFYLTDEGQAVESSDIFLHLGWVRANTLGTANIDFEFNQNGCPSPLPPAAATCTNGVTPDRKTGDMLVAYDFAGNTGRVDLGAYRWAAAAADLTAFRTTCEASSSAPCWTARMDLVATGLAAGDINRSLTPVLDTTGFDRDDPLGLRPQYTFGEASIDLTSLLSRLAGSAQCTAFGSAYLKSRSSTSFTSQMKDFIAPLAIDVSNCHVATPGAIRVTKTDDTGGPVAATFQLYGNTVVRSVDTFDSAAIIAGKQCSTSTSGRDAGTCLISNLTPRATYWVAEGTLDLRGVFTEGPPAGHSADRDGTHKKVVVTAASNGDGDTVDVAFTNPRKFKVVVYVCDESTGQLYPSTVTGFGGPSAGLASTSSAALNDSVAEAEICGATATDSAAFEPFGTGATPTGSVSIPARQ